MSAAFIERQNAYFAALDSVELDEESSSSEEEDEEEKSSASEEEEDVPGEQVQEPKEQRVDEEAVPEHGQHTALELSLAAAAEGDEHVLVGDSSRPNVYGRGSSGSSYDSAELFDAVVGAGSVALSAALSQKRRRHTASTESLTLTDVIDDSCDLSLSPVADDRPSSPDAGTLDEANEVQLHGDEDSRAKRIRLVLPSVAAPVRKGRALKSRPGSSNRLLLLKVISKGDTDAVKRLLAKGVSLDFFTAEGQTPLGHCLMTVAVDCVLTITKLLLRGGADPNLTVTVAYEQDEQERTGPLELALGRGLPELVLLLLKHGATPQRAARVNEYQLLQYAREGHFTSLATDMLRRSMCTAVAAGDAAQVAVLASHGADCEDVDEHGRSLLHRALSGSRRSDSERVTVVEALLASGARPNRADTLGVVPLCFPILRNDNELVKTLLRHGAEITLARDAISNS
jgi:ankyrin repeat protein